MRLNHGFEKIFLFPQNPIAKSYNTCYTFEEVISMDFPSIVKMAREKTGMSQEDLARAINVSFATINRWENGKTSPNKMAASVFFDFCKRNGVKIKNATEIKEQAK